MTPATLMVGAVLLAIAGGIYALHRLALYLESRDLIYYLRKPQGSAGYNPLQEFVQPQIRHVQEVQEQRIVEDDDAGP
jgi:hypothetical protein